MRRTTSSKANVLLWIAQVLLALLFLFAGSMKFVMPVEKMSGPIAFSGLFIHFIGICEMLGAVGLVLPWLLRIRPELTPIAASGLVIIMIGATTVTIIGGPAAGAIVPAVVGALAATIAYGRRTALTVPTFRTRRAHTLHPAR